jgi:hypothetical protein
MLDFMRFCDSRGDDWEVRAARAQGSGLRGLRAQGAQSVGLGAQGDQGSGIRD